jgi:hypothetical protein
VAPILNKLVLLVLTNLFLELLLKSCVNLVSRVISVTSKRQLCQNFVVMELIVLKVKQDRRHVELVPIALLNQL